MLEGKWRQLENQSCEKVIKMHFFSNLEHRLKDWESLFLYFKNIFYHTMAVQYFINPRLCIDNGSAFWAHRLQNDSYIAISEKNSQEQEDKPLFLDRMHIANI